MTTEFLWRSLDEPGFEHVRLNEDHPGWHVFDSIFVREHDGQTYRGGYTLVVDKEWRTLEVRFMVEDAPGSMISMHLLSDGEGNWTDADERPIPAFNGCMDIDIQWSPLTNTLPVNRLRLAVGDEHVIRVVYFALPSLELSVVKQEYTRLDDSTLRCSSETRDVVRDISVDEGGYVEEYPELFLRG